VHVEIGTDLGAQTREAPFGYEEIPGVVVARWSSRRREITCSG